MAAFSVSYSKLNDTANALSSRTQELKTAFDSFYQVLVSVGNVWESEAQDEFKKEFSKLQGNFEGYTQIISKFSTHLTKTAQEYKTRDDAVKNDVSALRGDALFRV